MVGTGLTVIVKVAGTPLQTMLPMVAAGVTVIVPVKGDVPAFVAIKDGISPVPLAANPIDVVLLAQLNTVPAMALEKAITFVEELLHTI